MSISEQKIKSFIDEGYEEIGVILQKDGRRVIVDRYGVVHRRAACVTGEMFSRIADLEEALKIAVVKLQGEQDPIGWPIDRFVDVISGRPFR